jgi:Terpene cyclase DEP1
MIIAQVVAVSTASSLFFLALSLRTSEPKPIPSKKNDDDIKSVLPPSEIEAEVSAQTIIPILLGLFAISICPAPTSPDFIPIILILHGLLLIPVLPLPFQTNQPRFLNMPTITVYFAVTALSLVLRMQSTLAVAVSLPKIGILEFAAAAYETLGSHPAMATLGWDTIWTTASFLIWTILGDGSSQPKLQSLILVVTSTAALGVSFSAPMALGNVINEIFTQSDVKETLMT